MPLYQMTVSVTMTVLADDEEDAEETALKHAYDELLNGCAQVDIDAEIKTLADVPLYDRNAIPWGGDQDKTCRQILEEAAATPPAVLPGQETLPGLLCPGCRRPVTECDGSRLGCVRARDGSAP